MANLPKPTTVLPREKPIPKPKPLTKWQKFAQKKGIVKKKRSKLVYDEDADEWRRRHGYKKAGDPNDVQVRIDTSLLPVDVTSSATRYSMVPSGSYQLSSFLKGAAIVTGPVHACCSHTAARCGA